MGRDAEHRPDSLCLCPALLIRVALCSSWPIAPHRYAGPCPNKQRWCESHVSLLQEIRVSAALRVCNTIDVSELQLRFRKGYCIHWNFLSVSVSHPVAWSKATFIPVLLGIILAFNVLVLISDAPIWHAASLPAPTLTLWNGSDNDMDMTEPH